MRFIDEATIRVSAGHGGPGCVSFRRETFEPRGGPDGGDGGDGGNVIFIANQQLSTLQDFRYKREYRAPNGMHGSGSNKAGRDGENIVLRVPLGTIVRDAETKEVLIDFDHDGQEWVACKGGRGGKGNSHFTTSTHQAPRFAQPGEEGGALNVLLELKLLADVGIIGFPNAGKSTLISRISAAKPKIADYPFTTLTPNLGVVALPEGSSCVVADVPGLIEGAHKGAGLGHKFLKHIERTRLFIHLLDGTKILEDATVPGEEKSLAITGLIDRYIAIRTELGLFNEALLHKPELVVINKLDILQSDPELVESVRKSLRDRIASIRGTNPEPNEPLIISAAAGSGISELLFAVSRILKEAKRQEGGADKETVILPDSEKIRS
ncbi:MAG: hypothetical protein A2Z97_05525 [Bdellovibrionales bacterium GWB1_52_6]|nr:MAG: hypothetical protein A2Z97_05525 [Bdellovibrionales bacterium GWB1_52_6]OFZ05728.1 MAG: hypothetical protein A2X97_03430 [Bdellovibrionales bacterium GWA1_52_35]HCM40332.1 GTPase ObgE [Bdellovibrionales bacterium]